VIDGISTAAASAVQSPARPKDDPARVKDAARQFEALLIGQMLKGMREAEGGWMGTGDDQSMSAAMEYAQEMFAQSLAAAGGLGLARVVAASFNTPTGG
jgi:Rod binding domain-containing protein